MKKFFVCAGRSLLESVALNREGARMCWSSTFPWKPSVLVLAMCALGAISTAQNTNRPAPARFDAPVELTVDGKPVRDIRYASPTLHDIDADSRRELLIGDIRGHIRVARPGADQSGLGWTQLEFQKSRFNRPIKLSNW